MAINLKQLKDKATKKSEEIKFTVDTIISRAIENSTAQVKVAAKAVGEAIALRFNQTHKYIDQEAEKVVEFTTFTNELNVNTTNAALKNVSEQFGLTHQVIASHVNSTEDAFKDITKSLADISQYEIETSGDSSSGAGE